MVTIVNRNDPMDVRDLQVFLSVAKHLNYTRAGEEVNLSQPSVSVRMRELERDLGSKLFEQLGKKIALTEAGQLLVPYATRIIAAMSDARQAIDELQGLERGLLRIGASTTPGMYLISRTNAHFKRRYPKIEVHLASCRQEGSQTTGTLQGAIHFSRTRLSDSRRRCRPSAQIRHRGRGSHGDGQSRICQEGSTEWTGHCILFPRSRWRVS